MKVFLENSEISQKFDFKYNFSLICLNHIVQNKHLLMYYLLIKYFISDEILRFMKQLKKTMICWKYYDKTILHILTDYYSDFPKIAFICSLGQSWEDWGMTIRPGKGIPGVIVLLNWILLRALGIGAGLPHSFSSPKIFIKLRSTHCYFLDNLNSIIILRHIVLN